MSRISLFMFLALALTATASRAESPVAVPSPEMQRLLDSYCAAVGKKDWDSYCELFHRNGTPVFHLRDLWKEHTFRTSQTQLDLLFQDNDLAILKLHYDIHWLDYKPPFTSEATCILILRKQETEWRIWSVSDLDSMKKG